MSKRSRTANLNAARWSPIRVGAIILVGMLGIFSLTVGVAFAFEVHGAKKHHAYIAGLPDVRSTPGTVGILEGHIAADVPQLRDGFVVYVREVYRARPGRASQPSWQVDHRKLQPLAIETSGGLVHVSNADYQFDMEVPDWSHGEVEESPPTLTQGAVRIRGLRPGKPVLIVGKAKPGNPPQEVVAHTIVGMDRASYLDQLRASSQRLRSVFPWLLGIAPFLIFYAGRGLWRIARAP